MSEPQTVEVYLDSSLGLRRLKTICTALARSIGRVEDPDLRDTLQAQVGDLITALSDRRMELLEQELLEGLERYDATE